MHILTLLIPCILLLVGLAIGLQFFDGTQPIIPIGCTFSGALLGLLIIWGLDSNYITGETIQIQEYHYTDNGITYVDLSGETEKIVCNDIKIEQTNNSFLSMKVVKGKATGNVTKVIIYEATKDNNNNDTNTNKKLKCNNCSNEDISENANFCSECGNKIN